MFPHPPTPHANSPSRIGDWSPERPFFQILIALTSGPRFILIFLQWLVTRRKARDEGLRKKRDDAVVAEGKKGLSAADWVALVGVARTFTWYASSQTSAYTKLTYREAAAGYTSHQQTTTVRPFPPLPYLLSAKTRKPPFPDFHDLAMIAYLLLTIPWMFGTIALTPRTQVQTLKYRYASLPFPFPPQ